MNAIAKLEFKKKIQDKGLWFWTFILPIVFIVGFISIFGGNTGTDSEQLVVQIVPGYTVMFSFYIMISIVIAFIKDRDSGMTARIASTPLPTLQYFMGKWIPFILIVLIQIAVLFGFGVAVYDMPLGNAFALIMISVALAFVSTGCGMAMAVIAKTENMGIALTQVIALGGAMLGGLWMPVEFMPDIMQNIAQFLPHYWALQGYQTVILDGGNVLDVWASLLVLIAYGAVCISIALSAYPRYLKLSKS
ncbi:ABC transporter permease [Jeotgalibacillus malaysiensis]|uniref:Transport permease protein n=1 Tax=Jeotgalibacillus malaysiensis TaxID=1508404 RepID=A0A0B5ANJ1_9BACL|nr:ABC transporter permease [Jeotgalibacillus malaysiensis]AJD89569.1 ABC transporter permease [Jeotgalibacillus malaysiensis]